MTCEAILCFKNGKDLFLQTQPSKVIWWLLTQAGISILFVSGCMLYHKYIQKDNKNDRDTSRESSPSRSLLDGCDAKEKSN